MVGKRSVPTQLSVRETARIGAADEIRRDRQLECTIYSDERWIVVDRTPSLSVAATWQTLQPLFGSPPYALPSAGPTPCHRIVGASPVPTSSNHSQPSGPLAL